MMSATFAWTTKTRNQRLKDSYGITEAIYEQILKKQDGRCAICRCKQRFQRLAVDHDHKTGMVRGLLCVNCNRGLGRFFDSLVRLRAAADYLERAQKVWDLVMKPNGDVN